MKYRQISKPLAAVCYIQSGLTVKRGLKPFPEEIAGGIPAIQLRDVSDKYERGLAGLDRYKLEGSVARYEVRGGDVLFRSRGPRNEAILITPQTEGTAVAVQPLLILRPIPNVLDPRYLAWFINQPHAQRHFDGCARGTSMRMIPKRCLEELEIALPELETQKRIAEISALAAQEHALAIRLAEKKLEFTNFALLEQVQNARPHGNGTGRSSPRKPKGRAG